MKLVSLILTLIICHNVYAQKNTQKKKVEVKEVIPTATSTSSASASAAPCDTKEDLAKKLEEEKKKLKPFSLQGGNTGCSVNEKK